MGSFTAANYYAWTELLPNQPYEQQITSFSVDAGDDIVVLITAPAGAPACDLVGNNTKSAAVFVCPQLGSTKIEGSEAEWIMERPLVNNTYAELSAYVLAVMTNAYVSSTKTPGQIPSGTAATLQLNMYNFDVNHPDNNLLSMAMSGGSDTIFFQWINFH
jgi:hypothetical protein